MMRPILLKGGRVLDPSQKLDERVDLLLAEGVVARWGRALEVPEGAQVIELPDSCVVTAGFVDLHVHLREPGG
ncbi:MAG: dihydroorotase, partial [Gemmatimonadota bacterium]